MSAALEGARSAVGEARTHLARFVAREEELSAALQAARDELGAALIAGDAKGEAAGRKRVQALEAEQEGIPSACERLRAELGRLERQEEAEDEAHRKAEIERTHLALLAHRTEGMAHLQAYLREHLLPWMERDAVLEEELRAAGDGDPARTWETRETWGLVRLLEPLKDLANDGPAEREWARRERGPALRNYAWRSAV